MPKQNDFTATETGDEEGCIHDDIDKAGESFDDAVKNAGDSVKETVHDVAKGVADLTDSGERTDDLGGGQLFDQTGGGV